MKKYDKIEDYLVGRGYSGFTIMSFQSHLTKPWEMKYRNGKNSHFLDTDHLVENLKSQNVQLFKKITKLFPEYLI